MKVLVENSSIEEGFFGWKRGDWVINIFSERVGKIKESLGDGEYSVQMFDNVNRDWEYKPTGKFEHWDKRNFVKFKPYEKASKQWKKPDRSYGF